MKSIRDIVNVAIALILLSFIGLSLVRLTYTLLHSHNIL